MELVPIHPAWSTDTKADPMAARAVRETHPKELDGKPPSHILRAAHDLLVERRPSGTAVTGPMFYVWDEDHGEAMSWSKQLYRGATTPR